MYEMESIINNQVHCAYLTLSLPMKILFGKDFCHASQNNGFDISEREKGNFQHFGLALNSWLKLAFR